MDRASVLKGLTTQDNYEIALQGEATERENVMLMAAEAKQREKEHMELSSAMSEYLGQFQDLEFDEQDISKVREIEKRERNRIAGLIRGAGGDVKRFLKSGGYNHLKQYAGNIKNSKEYQNAQKSGVNYKLLLENVVNNPENVAHKVAVTVDGEERLVHMDEAVKLKAAGKIDYLPYKGHFKAVNTAKMMEFFKSNAAPDTPYSRQVHPNEMKAYLKTLNKPDWYVEDFVKRETETFDSSLMPHQANPEYGYHWGQNLAELELANRRHIANVRAQQAQQEEENRGYFATAYDAVSPINSDYFQNIEVLNAGTGQGNRITRNTAEIEDNALTADITVGPLGGRRVSVNKGTVANVKSNEIYTDLSVDQAVHAPVWVMAYDEDGNQIGYEPIKIGVGSDFNLFGDANLDLKSMAEKNSNKWLLNKGSVPTVNSFTNQVLDFYGDGINTEKEGSANHGGIVLSVDPKMFTEDGWERYFPNKEQQLRGQGGEPLLVFKEYVWNFSNKGMSQAPEGYSRGSVNATGTSEERRGTSLDGSQNQAQPASSGPSINTAAN